MLAAQGVCGRGPRWGARCSCGTCGRIGPNAPQNERVEVIGVVAHQRHESLVEARTRSDLLRRKLLRPRRRLRWAIRTSGPPESIAESVRAAVAEIDPKLPLGEVQPMSAFVEKSIAPTRFAVVLVGVFAAGRRDAGGDRPAGVLATVDASAHTRKSGLRMVLGAPRQSILRLIIGEGLRLSMTGVVFGT